MKTKSKLRLFREHVYNKGVLPYDLWITLWRRAKRI